MSLHKKILSIGDLTKKVRAMRKKGLTVVQSHGVFDIIHPGIIKNFSELKNEYDTLVVTVIKDKDVRKGPGRPIFQEKLRADNVAALERVDYVCLVDDDAPFDCVKKINPDFLARDKAVYDRDRKIHDNIFDDNNGLIGESRILETAGLGFSSSGVINNFLDIFPRDTRDFLHAFSKKYSFDTIMKGINSFKNMKVLIVGDGIVDEYHYCRTLGKSAKSPLVAYRYISQEIFAGGVFAIANHVGSVCDTVNIVSLLGNENSRKEFIVEKLKPNIIPTFFLRDDGPTIVKKRYLDQYLNQKLFEINYLKDQPVSAKCENEIINYLTSEAPKYDLVMVADFGHGCITPAIINNLRKLSNILTVNTQTNAANTGFNLITKYSKPNFVCLDEVEARLALQNKYDDIEFVAKKLLQQIDTEVLIITLGKGGSIITNDHGKSFFTPIFSSKVVDTVGAGDAVFSYTALCYTKGMPVDLTAFIGNAVGAIAVQSVCNKKSVEKFELLELIDTILKQK